MILKESCGANYKKHTHTHTLKADWDFFVICNYFKYFRAKIHVLFSEQQTK